MFKIKSSILPGLLACICCIFCCSEAFAQPKSNSPLSRLGIGDYLSQSYVPLAGMGSLSAAYSDSYNLNIHNPASLASLKATSFEVGLFSQYDGWEEQARNTKNGTWTGNISYIGLGFPLKNPINEVLDRKKSPIRMGMSFSLSPYTRVGYQIIDYDYLESVDSIQYNYTGDGGTYKLQWGNAIKYKDLSFGVNLGFIFGKMSFDTPAIFPGFTFNTIIQNDFRMNGFIWNAGLLYDLHFKETDDNGEQVNSGKKLVFGLTGSSNTSFSTKATELVMRSSSALGLERDTFVYNADVEGKGTLPGEWTFGVMYENANKFRLGADFQVSSWSQYENDAKPETLKNTFRIGIGAEIIPDHISYNSYAKKIRYRIGMYYKTDPRNLEGFGQFKDFGASVGFGLPIILPRQQKTFINVALEAGKQGVSNYLTAAYARISIGFTLNDDRWFFKRKFN